MELPRAHGLHGAIRTTDSHRFAMPATKHRRKGKVRPRGNIKTWIPPRPSFEEGPEILWEDALIQERCRQLYGESPWSDDEWDEATAQLVAEGKVRPYEELARA
jgi:hypothetical protein